MLSVKTLSKVIQLVGSRARVQAVATRVQVSQLKSTLQPPIPILSRMLLAEDSAG